MNYKRITLLSGHYGSGKTNIAVNMARELASQVAKARTRAEADVTSDVTKEGETVMTTSASEATNLADAHVVIADLDIVNPYFRSLDSKDDLTACGVRMICSEFANTNLDAPALPQEIYSITDDKSVRAIIDVGGDERGALALGRLSERILEEGDYEMYLVINKYRPLTPDAESVLEIAREIEVAGHLPFTGIINCSNLGAETDIETIKKSFAFARQVSELTNLPLRALAIEESLVPELLCDSEALAELGEMEIFPMTLQARPI